jgi:hypothetical protein
VKGDYFMACEIRGVSSFVIFLDIDGVLFTRKLWEAKINQKTVELDQRYPGFSSPVISEIATSYFFDKNALKALDTLISQIEKRLPVKIVISSRRRAYTGTKTLIEEIFKPLFFAKYILGTTPVQLPLGAKNYCSFHYPKGKEESCRAAEIKCWLTNHSAVQQYVVIDDEDDHLSMNFQERFTWINPSTLLTEETVSEIVQRFF